LLWQWGRTCLRELAQARAGKLRGLGTVLVRRK
jgi:hypothetical protein